MNTFSDVDPVSLLNVHEDRSATVVLTCGVATTALALLGVYLLNNSAQDFQIMGWYADYVIPAGAMLVGFVAASGYGLGSWFTGMKITRTLLWVVLALQLAAYFTAEYIEFHSLHLIHRNGTPVGFFEYYDAVARSFAWQQHNGKPGAPLGAWGYLFRGLEVIGFVGGSIAVPLLLRKVPYCDGCRRYMKSRDLICWAASVPAKKIEKSDTAALEVHAAEQRQAFDKGKATWEAIKESASASNAAEFQTQILGLEPQKKAAKKLPKRLILKLVHCRRCCSGWLRVDLLDGQGREIKRTELERLPLQKEFVQAIGSPLNLGNKSE